MYDVRSSNAVRMNFRESQCSIMEQQGCWEEGIVGNKSL